MNRPQAVAAHNDVDRAPLDRQDVESLLAMSRVHLAASGHPDVAPQPAIVPTFGATGEGARLALADAQHARYLLSQQQVLGPTRLRLPKRAVLRFSRLFTHRLVAASQSLADGIEHLVRVQHESLDEVERAASSLRAQQVSAELALQDGIDALAATVLEGSGAATPGLLGISQQASSLAVLEGRLAELERNQAKSAAQVQRLKALLSSGAQPTGSVGSGADGPAEVIDDVVYAAFEKRFRGSREEIRARQLDALRFVAPLVGAHAPVVDLGCGRGEWLEVLRDAGIPAYGVDSSRSMVSEAIVAGLDARNEDALTHLEALPEGQIQGVTAFHFAEHVPVSVLTQILDAAFLALRPGGTIVLETPNPTNLIVGSAAFYLDPTHLRPLHPDFFAFLAESRGFTDVQIHFVHPVIEAEVLRAGAVDSNDPRTERLLDASEWALFGPQDYVLVAYKPEIAV